MTAAGAPVEELSASSGRQQRFPGLVLSGPVLSSRTLACWPPTTACGPSARRALRTAHGDAGDSPASIVRGRRRGDRRRRRASPPPWWSVCAGPPRSGSSGSTPRRTAVPRSPRSRTSPPGDGDLPPVFIEWGRRHGLRLAGARRRPSRRHLQGGPATHPAPPVAAFDPADPAPLAGDDPDQLAQLTGAVARLLPTLDPQPVATERCVYDNSADTDFVLDRVGQHRRRMRHQRARLQIRSAAGGDPGRPGRGAATCHRSDPLQPAPRAVTGRRAGRPAPGRLRACPAIVALLRSVNVAGHGRLAMDDLRASFDALGYDDVTTYIQTGNVLFTTGSKSEAGIATPLSSVWPRNSATRRPSSCAAWPTSDAIGSSSPYAKAGADPARHHVTFLATAPTKAALDALACRPAAATSSSSTARRSTSTRRTDTPTPSTPVPSLERRLGVVSTTRNWNTVTKLSELAAR